MAGGQGWLGDRVGWEAVGLAGGQQGWLVHSRVGWGYGWLGYRVGWGQGCWDDRAGWLTAGLAGDRVEWERGLAGAQQGWLGDSRVSWG